MYYILINGENREPVYKFYHDYEVAKMAYIEEELEDGAILIELYEATEEDDVRLAFKDTLGNNESSWKRYEVWEYRVGGDEWLRLVTDDKAKACDEAFHIKTAELSSRFAKNDVEVRFNITEDGYDTVPYMYLVFNYGDVVKVCRSEAEAELEKVEFMFEAVDNDMEYSLRIEEIR